MSPGKSVGMPGIRRARATLTNLRPKEPGIRAAPLRESLLDHLLDLRVFNGVPNRPVGFR